MSGDKVSVLIDNIIICLENPREATDKCLEMREFVKMDGYKINILKLIVTVCSNNSKLENIIQEYNLIYNGNKKKKQKNLKNK